MHFKNIVVINGLGRDMNRDLIKVSSPKKYGAKELFKNILFITCGLFVAGYCLSKTPLYQPEKNPIVEDGKTLKSINKRIVEEYKQNGKTKFRDFHEKFIVLKELGLPNIYGAEYDFHFNPADYNNPQKLLEYKEHKIQTRDRFGRDPEAAQLYRTRKNQKFKVSNEELEQQFISLGAQHSAFVKDGYYSYFSQMLKNKPNTQVDICLELDIRKLGVIGTGVHITYDQGKQMKQDGISSILSVLSEEGYSNVNLDTGSGCEIRLSANKEVLDQAYSNELVRVIIHPEIILTNSTQIKLYTST